MITSLLHNLFPFDGPTTDGERLHLRVLEVLVVGLALDRVWSWLPYIERISEVTRPVGLANYLDVSPLLQPGSARLLAVALAVLLLVGMTRRSRVAYAAALACFHLLYVTRFSLGKVGHGSHFIGLGVLTLAIGAWAFRRQPQQLPRFTFGFLTFHYAFGYTMAGVCKLVATGPSWPASAHLRLWIAERGVDVTSALGAHQLNPLQQLVLDAPWLATGILAAGLVTELAGLSACWRQLRPWVFSAMIGLHIGIDLTLNIFFGPNIYLLAAVAYPWDRPLDRLARALPPSLRARL